MYISDAIAFACAQSHISAKRIRHLHWCISATSIKHINKPFGIVVWSTLAPRPKQSVPTPTRIPHAPSAQIIDDSESFCVFVVRRRWHTKHTKWSHPYIYIYELYRPINLVGFEIGSPFWPKYHRFWPLSFVSAILVCHSDTPLNDGRHRCAADETLQPDVWIITIAMHCGYGEMFAFAADIGTKLLAFAPPKTHSNWFHCTFELLFHNWYCYILIIGKISFVENDVECVV